jgi:hypothetical protein
MGLRALKALGRVDPRGERHEKAELREGGQRGVDRLVVESSGEIEDRNQRGMDGPQVFITGRLCTMTTFDHMTSCGQSGRSQIDLNRGR